MLTTLTNVGSMRVNFKTKPSCDVALSAVELDARSQFLKEMSSSSSDGTEASGMCLTLLGGDLDYADAHHGAAAADAAGDRDAAGRRRRGAQARGVLDNQHSTDIASPHSSPPRACMSTHPEQS
jgi:hypothetical protein